jgi:hypothetical protein
MQSRVNATGSERQNLYVYLKTNQIGMNEKETKVFDWLDFLSATPREL